MFQVIHMKNQALFSSKDKSKNLKCRLLQFSIGALRVNIAHKQAPRVQTLCKLSIGRWRISGGQKIDIIPLLLNKFS